MEVYSPIFKTARVAKIFARKYARILFCPWTFCIPQSSQLSSSYAAVRFSKQIMSVHKYLSIFSRQIKAFVYMCAFKNIFKILKNPTGVWKITLSLPKSASFTIMQILTLPLKGSYLYLCRDHQSEPADCHE